MACTDVAKVKAKATAINLIILSSNSNKVNLQELPAQSRLFCALDCSQIAKSILRLRGAFSGPRPWAFPGLLKRWGMEWGTLPGNTRKALSINRPWRRGFEPTVRLPVQRFSSSKISHVGPCRVVAKCALWFGISNAMIPVCDAPCHSVLRSWFANPFATFVTAKPDFHKVRPNAGVNPINGSGCKVCGSR